VAAPSRPAVQQPRKSVAAPALIPWQWPVDGGVAKLTQRPNGGHGLTITGRLGQEIRAASSGRIVYLGTGLLGYGQLLIIKHNDSYLSAYGHTQSVAVKEGDAVVMGQRIATMGAGPQGSPMLYFEIRSNGTPGNPLLLLPKR
jgi:lipoprotein NlpD